MQIKTATNSTPKAKGRRNSGLEHDPLLFHGSPGTNHRASIDSENPRGLKPVARYKDFAVEDFAEAFPKGQGSVRRGWVVRYTGRR